MDSLNEALELCRRITTGYRPALRNSPVADCTRRFELLPLRYAAVGGNPAQRARLPKLPGYLSPFQDVGEMTHSSYADGPRGTDHQTIYIAGPPGALPAETTVREGREAQ